MKLSSKQALRLYELTKYHPACILTNVLSFLIPSLIVYLYIKKNYNIRIEKKSSEPLSEQELLKLLEKIQQK